MSEMDVRVRLLDAIEDGEVLLVRYSGGTQPGTIRELEPTDFIGADKIWASCYASGKEKQFFLSKMEIIDSTDLGLVTYQSDDDDENESVDSDGYLDIEYLVEKPSFGKRLWRVVKWILIGYVALALIAVIFSVIFR